jgi:hypothetical protein
MYVNGFDHPDILAGQGTMGLEILEQVPNVDAVVIPVGGGGLIAGCAMALKTMKPDIIIIVSEIHDHVSKSDYSNQYSICHCTASVAKLLSRAMSNHFIIILFLSGRGTRAVPELHHSHELWPPCPDRDPPQFGRRSHCPDGRSQRAGYSG